MSLNYILFATFMIAHIWTAVIAFISSGFLVALISFMTPPLSNLIWMIIMIGENNLYSIFMLIGHISIFIYTQRTS